ncbi:MAG: hypothetical protein COZ17_02820 [Flavobacteriaceae bacterium CG_4_10_14_3_um_filter_33_47]|nr:MAG: hypothetical protein COZ17_02820 [Flavobacteriaceae bacterium CG_4_10_14_3_um_filter_33_47]PJB18883.1 MAG: hypothetical protein CO117_06745 [Flavobacteriaceae bacterium CG_4_9_14_3_um_filter_33_16]
MRGLALTFASTHQTENPRGFSEVGENKQLLIAIVIISFYFSKCSILQNQHQVGFLGRWRILIFLFLN